MGWVCCLDGGDPEFVQNFGREIWYKLGRRWVDNANMDIRKRGCEDWRLMKLAYDYVRLWNLTLAVLNPSGYYRKVSFVGSLHRRNSNAMCVHSVCLNLPVSLSI